MWSATPGDSTGRPPIRQIYKACCSLELTDQKLVGNKGVFKGNVCCKLLYLSENQSLYLWQQKLPFSQYCELQKDYDQEDLAVAPILTGYDLDLEGQEDIRRVLLNVNVLAQCVVTGVQPLSLTEDAYCTHGKLEPTWKQYQLDAKLDQQRSLQTVRQSLTGPLQEILDTDVYLDFPALERQENQAKVVAPLTLRVLGLDENGVLTARSAKAEAVQEFALSDQAACRLSATPAGETYASLTGDGAEVRCGVNLETACYAKQSLRSLCGGTVEEEAEAGNRRPSVILRTVRKNDALWDVAKACNSTEDAIRSVNHIEGERLADAAMLLIPVG